MVGEPLGEEGSRVQDTCPNKVAPLSTGGRGLEITSPRNGPGGTEQLSHAWLLARPRARTQQQRFRWLCWQESRSTGFTAGSPLRPARGEDSCCSGSRGHLEGVRAN